MKFCFTEIMGIKKLNDVDLTTFMSSFYKQKASDKILLLSNRSKNEVRNMLLNNDFLKREFGLSRMKYLKQDSMLLFSTDHLEIEEQNQIKKLSDEVNNERETKRIIDMFYNDLMITIKNLSILLSMGIWMVKDSNVQPRYIFLATGVNNYTSTFNIKLDYTNSEGKYVEVNLTKEEIECSKKMMTLLYEHVLNIKESGNKRPNIVDISEVNYFEINRQLSTNNPSFTKTLMLIQEARNQSFLASKVDKYIAALQCILAVSDDFTFNCSRITAAYISKGKKEHSDIIDCISKGYHIRSQVSHGKKIDEDKYNLERISKKLDVYLRRILKKALLDKRLNYISKDEENWVKTEFKKIAVSEFKDEYDNRKKDNRLAGIKRNILGIDNVDTLLDIETALKNRINELL